VSLPPAKEVLVFQSPAVHFDARSKKCIKRVSEREGVEFSTDVFVEKNPVVLWAQLEKRVSLGIALSLTHGDVRGDVNEK